MKMKFEVTIDVRAKCSKGRMTEAIHEALVYALGEDIVGTDALNHSLVAGFKVKVKSPKVKMWHGNRSHPLSPDDYVKVTLRSGVTMVDKVCNLDWSHGEPAHAGDIITYKQLK